MEATRTPRGSHIQTAVRLVFLWLYLFLRSSRQKSYGRFGQANGQTRRNFIVKDGTI